MFSKLDKISRRDFMKVCSVAAAAAGVADLLGIEKIVHALEAALKKPPVIWLEGLSCTGCTHSLISMEDPTPWSLILDRISLRYHDTIMAASGYTAEKAKEETIKAGGYILAVEGAVPEADDRFCVTAGRPFKEIVIEAAEKADVIICAGNCSSFGGLPAGMPSGGIPVSKIIKDKPVINLPTCPVHMDHLYGTVLYYIVTRKAPELDKYNRPLMYFEPYIHDNCRRRGHYENDEFLTDWNDPAQRDWCLYQMGCKGPETNSDCPVRRWNNGINFCIDSGAPCQGCAEPDFYNQHSPLYKMASSTNRSPVNVAGTSFRKNRV